jgi:hypothetical protein
MQLAERLTQVQRLRLPWQPWSVLVPLGLLQWIGTAVFAARARHTGWYFHNDAHSTWAWTGGWLLGRAHISGVDAGWGWSYLLMPISWIAGADYVSALRILIVAQGLTLLPLGLALAYAAATRLGGRVVGYFTAALWVLGPFLAAAQARPGWTHLIEDELVAPALGLTGSVALPSALVLLGSAWFVLRALDGEQPVNGAAAGLAAGFAVAVEPLNGLFLAAVTLAFAVGRRPRAALGFASGLAPFLVALAVWRARGPDGVDLGGIAHAFHFSAARLSYTFTWVREDFWSLRLFQWIAAAGFVALVRVSPAKAVFVGSWLLVFVLFRGSDPTVDAHAGTFWSAAAPGLPAFCLLAGSLPLLLPAWRPEPLRAASPVPLRALAAVALVFAAAPLVLTVIGSPAHSRAALAADGSYVPADSGLGLHATVSGSTVTLGWRRAGSPAVSYSPYRGSERIANTYSTVVTDTPGPGTWTYRLAWQANEYAQSGGGITTRLSRPIAVRVR